MSRKMLTKDKHTDNEQMSEMKMNKEVEFNVSAEIYSCIKRFYSIFEEMEHRSKELEDQKSFLAKTTKNKFYHDFERDQNLHNSIFSVNNGEWYQNPENYRLFLYNLTYLKQDIYKYEGIDGKRYVIKFSSENHHKKHDIYHESIIAYYLRDYPNFAKLYTSINLSPPLCLGKKGCKTIVNTSFHDLVPPRVSLVYEYVEHKYTLCELADIHQNMPGDINSYVRRIINKYPQTEEVFKQMEEHRYKGFLKRIRCAETLLYVQQCMHVLKKVYHDLKFSHNDLHCNNVLLMDHSDQPVYLKYDGKNILSPGRIVKLIDFERSQIELKENNTILFPTNKLGLYEFYLGIDSSQSNIVYDIIRLLFNVARLWYVHDYVRGEHGTFNIISPLIAYFYNLDDISINDFHFIDSVFEPHDFYFFPKEYVDSLGEPENVIDIVMTKIEQIYNDYNFNNLLGSMYTEETICDCRVTNEERFKQDTYLLDYLFSDKNTVINTEQFNQNWKVHYDLRIKPLLSLESHKSGHDPQVIAFKDLINGLDCLQLYEVMYSYHLKINPKPCNHFYFTQKEINNFIRQLVDKYNASFTRLKYAEDLRNVRDKMIKSCQTILERLKLHLKKERKGC